MQTDKLTDSGTLTRAHATLRAQEAKGRAKYGTDLDGANLTVKQSLQHATEEAADLLMYLTDLPRRLDTLEEDLEWHRQFGEDMKRDRGVAEARVAELEAELVLTKQALDAQRHRAKEAERIMSDAYGRIGELEARLDSTESHRQALARELGEIQQWREADTKAANRMAERLQALEAENERLKAENNMAREMERKRWESARAAFGEHIGSVTVEVTP